MLVLKKTYYKIKKNIRRQIKLSPILFLSILSPPQIPHRSIAGVERSDQPEAAGDAPLFTGGDLGGLRGRAEGSRHQGHDTRPAEGCQQQSQIPMTKYEQQ